MEKVVRSKQYAQLVKELFVPRVDEGKRVELERRVWKPAAVAKEGFPGEERDSPGLSPYGMPSPRKERTVASGRPPALRLAGNSPARHRQPPVDRGGLGRPASGGRGSAGENDPRGAMGMAEAPAITPEGRDSSTPRRGAESATVSAVLCMSRCFSVHQQAAGSACEAGRSEIPCCF